jgi:hypothetical protein
MDAMQKRRMWKVAIAHFVLTFLVFANWRRLSNGDSVQYVLWADSWRSVFFLLQPQIWLVLMGEQISVFREFYSYFPDVVVVAICFSSIPIWSLCFGWLFVKLDNWLNHFPVLGRKVF